MKLGGTFYILHFPLAEHNNRIQTSSCCYRIKLHFVLTIKSLAYYFSLIIFHCKHKESFRSNNFISLEFGSLTYFNHFNLQVTYSTKFQCYKGVDNNVTMTDCIGDEKNVQLTAINHKLLTDPVHNLIT